MSVAQGQVTELATTKSCTNETLATEMSSYPVASKPCYIIYKKQSNKLLSPLLKLTIILYTVSSLTVIVQHI